MLNVSENRIESNSNLNPFRTDDSLAIDSWTEIASKSNLSNRDDNPGDQSYLASGLGFPMPIFVDSAKTTSARKPVKAEKPGKQGDQKTERKPVVARKPLSVKAAKKGIDSERKGEPNPDSSDPTVAAEVKEPAKKPDPEAGNFGEYDITKMPQDLVEAIKNAYMDALRESYPDLEPVLNQFVDSIFPDKDSVKPPVKDSVNEVDQTEIKAAVEFLKMVSKYHRVSEFDKDGGLKKMADNFAKNANDPKKNEVAMESFRKLKELAKVYALEAQDPDFSGLAKLLLNFDKEQKELAGVSGPRKMVQPRRNVHAK